MENIATLFMFGVMAVGLSALFLISICVLFCIVKEQIKKNIKSRRPLAMIIPLLFVCSLVIYGGSKSIQQIIFLDDEPEIDFIIDNGSKVEQDGIYLSFVTQIIPESANFYGFFKLKDSENAEWEQFLQGTIGAFLTPRTIPFENAENYLFIFYTDYVNAPSVHTNGVMNVNWALVRDITTGEKKISEEQIEALPMKTTIKTYGDIISQSIEEDEEIKER